jgi:hypothetical protein
MPDKILRIKDVRRSIYDPKDVVIELEAMTPDNIRYIRVVTLKDALSEYDVTELIQKLSEYQNGIKLRLQLSTNLILTLLGAKA